MEYQITFHCISGSIRNRKITLYLEAVGEYLDILPMQDKIINATYPDTESQSGKQRLPSLKCAQERHWSEPGPQHPSSEHSASHTRPAFSVTRECNTDVYYILFHLSPDVEVPMCNKEAQP
jgi:hypothetical protein